MAGLLNFPQGAAFGTGSPAETAQQPSGLGGLLSGLYNSLGFLSQKAIGSSQTALDTGIYNPAPVLAAAMLPMGTGAIAGVPVRAGEAVIGAGPIRAYHGSPYDFDRFDLSKIGTGEGAQAYGHGLYFAEKEGVAKGYRDQLASGTYKAPGEIFNPSSLGHLNVRTAARNGIDSGIVRAKELLKSQPQNAEMLQRDLQMLLAMEAKGVSPNTGRMYEVNINADPARFLDWEKGGKKLYNETMDSLPNNLPIPQYGPLTAKSLSDRGVPGIKYLDQGSRASGQGSSNYVVFDDRLIDILMKYGIALPGAAGAAAFAGQGQGQAL